MANVTQLGCRAQRDLHNSGTLRQRMDALQRHGIVAQLVALLSVIKGLPQGAGDLELQARLVVKFGARVGRRSEARKSTLR